MQVDYYEACRRKDLTGMARYLHPDVRMTNPMTTLVGKEAVLEAAAKFLLAFDDLRIGETATSGDVAFISLDVITSKYTMPSVSKIKFKDNLISEITLYLDPTPMKS